MAISQHDPSDPPYNIEKENCLGCDKFIWTDNLIMTCSSCDIIVHAKCAKSLFEFNNLENSWHCWQSLSKPPKYDPFSGLSHDKYDPNSLDDINDLLEISKILKTVVIMTLKLLTSCLNGGIKKQQNSFLFIQ